MYQFLEKKHADGLCFFEEAEMPDPSIRRMVLEDEMSPICIENWIKCGDANISKSQAGRILERIPLLYSMHSLKKKGFLDSIENCQGQEVFFLSEAGKEFGRALGWAKKQ
jgi:hypothetical protein